MNKLFNIPIVRESGLGPLNAVGIATREVVDYADDIVVVSGMESRGSDVVLLANHDQTKPIGRARLSTSGNEVKAYITFAPEGTTETADEYRKLCKSGVLTDLSIGFAPIERQAINGGGWRYTKWRCMEVSLVAVGCNPAAVIVQRSRKAGRVLSGSNATRLQQARDAVGTASDLIDEVLGQADGGGSDTAEAKAKRAREVDLYRLAALPAPTRSDRRAMVRELEVRSFSRGRA
jgi:HK97 family phage prohead protease